MRADYWKFITVLLCMFTMAAILQASTIYDVTSNFSLVSNPNGVWSYNQGNTPLVYFGPGWGGTDGSYWAAASTSTVPPAWGLTATTLDPGHWEAGEVVGHSTGMGAGATGNVKWTSPAAGIITISGAAWDAMHCCNRDDKWTLYVDGAPVATRGSIFGVAETDAAASFANNLVLGKTLNNLVVAAGSTVVFEIEALTPNGHFTALDLTITFDREQAQVPEPSFALPLLVALGLGGVVLRRVRRPRTPTGT